MQESMGEMIREADPKYYRELWKLQTGEDVGTTQRMVDGLKSGAALRHFTFDWGTIAEVVSGNPSLVKYLDAATIEECRALYVKYEEYGQQLVRGVTRCQEQGLGPEIEDAVGVQNWQKQMTDPNFLVIYESKLSLERKILDVLTTKSES